MSLCSGSKLGRRCTEIPRRQVSGSNQKAWRGQVFMLPTSEFHCYKTQNEIQSKLFLNRLFSIGMGKNKTIFPIDHPCCWWNGTPIFFSNFYMHLSPESSISGKTAPGYVCNPGSLGKDWDAVLWLMLWEASALKGNYMFLIDVR